MEKEIKAFWFESLEDEGLDDDLSGYVWECPHCKELNNIPDEFVWNGKKGKHCTKDTYYCEHCDSEEEYFITRD